MDHPDRFRQFARRCRELIPLTRVATVKLQLEVWADEFEERAEEVARERSAASN